MSAFCFVVAAYMAEAWIERCLRSLQSQALRDFRCMVIDDASPDATFEKARAAVAGDERFVVECNETKAGALGNRVPLVRSEWPFWNDAPASERPPGLGLWSVEPHFARAGVGVKWEELLVVDTDGAHWLEPDPLHTHP